MKTYEIMNGEFTIPHINQPIIEFKNVCKAYASNKVLNGISFGKMSRRPYQNR